MLDVKEMAELVGGISFDPDALRARYRYERDKRIRPDGTSQYIEVRSESSAYRRDPYGYPTIVRAPLDDMVDVAIMGTGFAGLLASVRLQQRGVTDIRLIDTASDFGGTWYWNRYPGANCDIESYIYLPLLEETGYVPRHKYSFGQEIFEYCQLIARQFGLYEKALFQTEVKTLTWDEESKRWIVRTSRGDQLRARHVIIAGGGLHDPKLPGIPGINEFKGHTFHTSRWDYHYTGGTPAGNTYVSGEPTSDMDKLSDKRVGIIGTGATSIQAVPPLAVASEHLFVFQRTPSSIDVRNNRETDVEWFKSQPPGWLAERAANFIKFMHEAGAPVDMVDDGWTDIAKRVTGVAAVKRAREAGLEIGRAERQALMELGDFKKMEEIRNRIATIVRDKATAEALKPWYRMFCKRPCFHDGYLPTFNRDNVTLVDTDGQGVQQLTEDGVVVGGKEYKLDCLIFATGFVVGEGGLRRYGSYNIIGRNGVALNQQWANGPATLFGVQSHGFPNIFFLAGPQTPRSFLVPCSYEAIATHIAYIVSEVQARGCQTVEVDSAAQQRWVDEVASKARPGAWFYEQCTPGYYNNEGKPTAKGSALFGNYYEGGPNHYNSLLRQWRDEGGLAGLNLM